MNGNFVVVHSLKGSIVMNIQNPEGVLRTINELEILAKNMGNAGTELQNKVDCLRRDLGIKKPAGTLAEAVETRQKNLFSAVV